MSPPGLIRTLLIVEFPPLTVIHLIDPPDLIAFEKIFAVLEKGLLAPTGPVQVVPGIADLTAAKSAVARMLSTIHKTK